MTKLQKFIIKLNPANELDFNLSIGYYWTIEVNGNIVKCTLDWNRNSCLNEKCKLENESQFNKSDLKNLYSVLNGYLKGKMETVISTPNWN